MLSVRHVRLRALVLPCLLLVVAVQTLINYHNWLMSGPDHLYYARHLNEHPFPYLGTRIEYPVLTGVFMTVSAALTHDLTGFLRLNSILLGACAVGCTCVLWSISRRAAYVFALSPLLLVYSLANWDMFAILLMLLGWRCYLKRHYGAAGAWLALGVFAKFFPIILLGGCFVALVKRWRTDQSTSASTDLRRFTLAAAGASAIVNLPFAVPAFRNWLWFWTFNDQRPGDADIFAWLHLLNTSNIGTINLVLTTAVAVAVIAGGVAIWRGMPVASVSAVVFLVFMVMEKVYSPQYTLWVFVYGLLADWDLWVLVAISILGLADDATDAVEIALIHGHSPHVLSWYLRDIQYRERGIRLLGLITVGAAMFTRDVRIRRRTQPDRAPSTRIPVETWLPAAGTRQSISNSERARIDVH